MQSLYELSFATDEIRAVDLGHSLETNRTKVFSIFAGGGGVSKSRIYPLMLPSFETKQHQIHKINL